VGRTWPKGRSLPTPVVNCCQVLLNTLYVQNRVKNGCYSSYECFLNIQGLYNTAATLLRIRALTNFYYTIWSDLMLAIAEFITAFGQCGQLTFCNYFMVPVIYSFKHHTVLCKEVYGVSSSRVF